MEHGDNNAEVIDGIATIQPGAGDFSTLDPREKALAWCLARAAIAGRDIAFEQSHRHAPDVRRVFEGILTHPGGIHPKALAAISAYARRFWIHNGNVEAAGARRFVPNLTPGEFRVAARQALRRGATFVADDAMLGEMLDRLEPFIFDTGDGLDAGNAVGTSPGSVEKVVSWIEEARRHALPGEREGLDILVRHLRHGAPEDLMRFQDTWAREPSRIYPIIGFVEGKWEGAVFVEDRERTALLRGVAGAVEELALVTTSVAAIALMGRRDPVASVSERFAARTLIFWNVIKARRAVLAARFAAEFAADPGDLRLEETWGATAEFACTALREMQRHGSQGGSGGVIEETRAELMALRYLEHPRMSEVGLVPHPDVVRQAVIALVREGFEDDHGRGRHLIVRWVGERTGAIEMVHRNGKHYLRLASLDEFRRGAEELLAELTRIDTEDDQTASRALVEEYGNFDPGHFGAGLRAEVMERSLLAGIPHTVACTTPELHAVRNAAGDIVDVTVTNPRDFTEQMLRLAEEAAR